MELRTSSPKREELWGEKRTRLVDKWGAAIMAKPWKGDGEKFVAHSSKRAAEPPPAARAAAIFQYGISPAEQRFVEKKTLMSVDFAAHRCRSYLWYWNLFKTTQQHSDQH